MLIRAIRYALTIPVWFAGGALAGALLVGIERLAWAAAADPDGAWRLTRALIGVAVLFALLVVAMSRRQHFKGKKRPRGWHRGRSAGRKWRRTDLPDVASGADPTQPTPPGIAHRGPGRRHRGDSL